MTIEELKIVIKAETEKLQKEVSKVNQSLDSVSKTTEKMQGKIKKGFNKIKVVAAAAFAAITYAATRFGKSLMKLASDLFTLEAQTGLSTDKLQEFQFIAEMAGTDINNITMGIKTLAQQIASGNPALKQLKITTQDTGEAFEQTLIALSKLPEGADKAALGNQLLGRSYQTLKPIIDLGEQGIRDFAAAAHNSGAVISRELLGKIDQLRQSLSQLGNMFKMAFMPIVDFVIPALQAFIKALTYTIGFIAGIIKAIFGSNDANEEEEKSNIDAAKGIDIKTKALKNLAKTYSGFDELNVVQQDTTTPGFEMNIPEMPIGEVKAIEDALEAAQKQAELFNDALAKGAEFWDKWGKWIALFTGIAAAVLVVEKALQPLILAFAWFAKGPFLAGLEGILKWFPKFYGELYMAFSQGEALGAFGKLIMAIFQGGATTMAAAGAVIAAVVATIIAVIESWKKNILSFKDRWLGVWEDIKTYMITVYEKSLKPILGKVIEVLTLVWNEGLKPLWNGFVKFVAGIGVIIAELIRFIMPFYQFMADVVFPIVAWVIGLIIEAFGELITPILWVFGEIIGVIGEAFGWFADKIAWVREKILEPFLHFITLIFAGDFAGAWEYIKEAWSGVGTFFSNIWKTIKDTFNKIPQWFEDKFTEAWTNVKNVFSTGGKIFDGIKEGIAETFKTIVNGLIEGTNRVIAVPFNSINGMLKKIRDISIVGLKPFNFISTISVPKIPKLARGGLVDAGQMFIAGERGAEMLGSYKGKTTVMPLENTDFTAAMKDAVREGLIEAMSINEGGDTVIMVDSMVLGRATEKGLNKLSQAKGGLSIAF